jgi:hypothetical protein
MRVQAQQPTRTVGRRHLGSPCQLPHLTRARSMRQTPVRLSTGTHQPVTICARVASCPPICGPRTSGERFCYPVRTKRHRCGWSQMSDHLLPSPSTTRASATNNDDFPRIVRTLRPPSCPYLPSAAPPAFPFITPEPILTSRAVPR